MTPVRETDRVIVYRCSTCRCIHADLKPGVTQMPTRDDEV